MKRRHFIKVATASVALPLCIAKNANGGILEKHSAGISMVWINEKFRLKEECGPFGERCFKLIRKFDHLVLAICYDKNGNLHSNDNPAIILSRDGKIISQAWLVHGLMEPESKKKRSICLSHLFYCRINEPY